MSLAARAAPFLLIAILALASAGRRRPLLFAVTKPGATLALLLVVGVPRGRYALMTAIGLVLSALGDAALLDESERRFLAGVFLFFCAHLAYVIAFAFPSGAEPASTHWILAILATTAIALATTTLLAKLWPTIEPSLKIPVLAYGAVITIMCAAAFRLTAAPLPRAAVAFAALGAVLFYSSDGVLAWSRFRAEFRGAERLNLTLYWSGQLGLSLAASLVDQAIVVSG